MALYKLQDAELRKILADSRKELPLKRISKSDGGGLVLYFNTNGKSDWWYRYSIAGKPNSMPLGVYPIMSLAEAREAHTKARKLWKEGIDPAQDRRRQKAEKVAAYDNRFESVSEAWFEKWKDGKTEKTITEKRKSLDRDLLPTLGRMPISHIKVPDLMRVHRKLEAKGIHSMNRKLWITGGDIFSFAVAEGLCERNIYRDTKFKDGFKVNKTKHLPTVDKAKIPQLLRDIDAYKGEYAKRALQLSAYLFVRKMELLEATWDEFDFDAKRWTIPTGRIKQRSYELIVDLPAQAIEILQHLKKLANGSKYVFHSSGKRGYMDKTAPLQALYRMGYKHEMSVHGFRAMAATQLKALGYQEGFIHRQLSHINGSKTHSAYFREQHLEDLPQRKAMLQDWANYLDAIKADAPVIQLKAG